MNDARKQDTKMLLAYTPSKLMEIFFAHIRNVWRVDGLYFLGIEEKFGTQVATEVDAYCHKILGKIEAKALINVLGIKERGIPELITALKHSCWSLDLTEKKCQVSDERAVFTVTACGTQQTRLAKDLPVFPCKQVRRGYLESFTRAFNPDLQCACEYCPPDERPGDAWCQWVFTSRANLDP